MDAFSGPFPSMDDSLLIRSRLFERHGAAAFFSLREAGDMGRGTDDEDDTVGRNLDAFVREAGLPWLPHQARQVHGVDVLACTGSGCMHSWEADILIAQGADCPVGVRVADCLPVLLADPEADIVAAVHAGWRGTARSVVGVAVEAMQRRGAQPERMIAALGPCIGPCCFGIGEDVAIQLAGSCDGGEMYVRDGRADLAGLNLRQLELAGIGGDRAENLGACTCCDGGRFFSYRRDGAASGRHLAVAVLERRP